MKGIDIASYQKGLTMTAVKNAGYEFAILRAGFTGYGASRSKNKDSQFENFYKAAKAVGIPVGAYWYSCANTRQGGVDEAKFMYDNCLKGKQFEFPIYIDIEEQRWQMNDKNGVTDAICGFCETLKALGFYVGIYSSTYWFSHYIDSSRLDKYSKWVAAWRSTKPSFPYSNFDMWQYGENGKISGIQVDLDISYKDFPVIIKAAGLNGFPKTEKKTVEELANEVLAGKWGNGDERKRLLTESGYDYNAVQDEVNRILYHNARRAGDVDGDGKVTAADAQLALRAAAGLENLDADAAKAADVNGDGKVTAEDARTILRKSVGLE